METTDEKLALHCDKCGFEIPIKKEDIESYIGAKCPKCGTIMLTEEDVEASKKFDYFIEVLKLIDGDGGDKKGIIELRTISNLKK